MNVKLTCVDRRGIACWLSVALLLILAGCGTSAYHSRMEAQLKKLKEIAASQPKVTMAMFYQYITQDRLPGEQRVNLRVPRCFTNNNPAFHEQTIDPRTGTTYLKPRMWPLGVEIPGYCWTYESTIPEGATEPLPITDSYVPPGDEVRWTYSFAFGALQVPPEVASEVMQTYLQELNAALADTTGANPPQIDLSRPESISEVEIENQQKEKIRWKVMHLEADMFFNSYQNRADKSWEKKPGVVEIYSTYHKQNLVILAGTWIKGMEASTLMPDFLPAIASTVTINDEGLDAPPAAE